MQTEQRYSSDPAKAEMDIAASAGNFMFQTAVRTAETAARGGDLIFEVDEGLNTLVDFRHKRKYAAGDGEQGGKTTAATEKTAKDLDLKCSGRNRDQRS